MNYPFRVFAVILFLGTVEVCADELLAFPGAEGFGRHASGGRGGEVYAVTKLKVHVDELARKLWANVEKP